LLCGSVDHALGTALRPLSGLASRVLGTGLAIRGTADRLRRIASRTRLVPELAYLFGGMCRERTPPEPVDALLRNLGRMNIDAVIHLARSYIDHTGRPLLADLRAPTLIIGGERDGLAPPEH